MHILNCIYVCELDFKKWSGCKVAYTYSSSVSYQPSLKVSTFQNTVAVHKKDNSLSLDITKYLVGCSPIN